MSSVQAVGGPAAPALNRSESPLAAKLTIGTLVAACVAVCVAQVAAAMPAVIQGLIQTDISPSSSQLTWVSDAFLVPITLLELSFGVLSDLFGRKRLLLGGTGLLVIGEALAFFTPGAGSSTDTRMLFLWIAQALSGIGAAAIFPCTLAMVASGTHSRASRSRGVAMWAAALSTGGMLSPVITGLVAKSSYNGDANAGWRYGFLAVAVMAVISLIASAMLARPSRQPEGRSIDILGQITLTLTIFPLLLAVIQGPSSGWGSPVVIVGFIVAAVSLPLFILVELRSDKPMLRLDFFKNRAFASAAAVTVCGMFAFLGTCYATSIRLTVIQGISPLTGALAFVFLNGIAFVQAPFTARLLERYDPKWPLAVGCTLIGGGDIWISTLSINSHGVAPMIAPLALVGIGFALAVSAVTAVTVNLVPSRLAGMASGTTNLLRDFGFTLGPAVAGGIALSRASSLIHSTVAASPALTKALASFNGSAAHAPAAERGALMGAIHAVNSSPLAANDIPATIQAGGHTVPFNPIKSVAFHSLGSGYSSAFLVCGIVGLVAAAIAVVGMSRRSYAEQADPEVVDPALLVR